MTYDTYDVNSDVNDMPDVEAMWQRECNVAAAEETLKESLPPVATYTTNPDLTPLTRYSRLMEEKDDQGNVKGRRLLATVSGIGYVTLNGKEYKAPLRFDVSPDKRYRREYVDGEWTGKVTEMPDEPSKLWGQSVAAYKEFYKESPKTDEAVLDYLTTTRVNARIYHSRDGQVKVGAIKAARRAS